MKALFIGGTGTISTAISKLAREKGWELYLLNRGTKTSNVPNGAKVLTADINNELLVLELIKDMNFNMVVDTVSP